jgi:hypothetical protein
MVLECTAFSTHRRRSAQPATAQRYNRIVTGRSNSGVRLYGGTRGAPLRQAWGCLRPAAALALELHRTCASGRTRSAFPASI